jgi:hypothetical protein
MSRRLLPLCALLLAASACPAIDSIVNGQAHLRVDRAGPSSRTLLDVPIEASWCASDTTLTIVGADRSWSVAIAVRTPWPPRSLEFTLDSAVSGAGSAAIAIRPLKDSIGVAMTAVRGTLKLSTGDRAAGTLDIVAAGEHDTVRLAGTLTAARVTPGGCPAP